MEINGIKADVWVLHGVLKEITIVIMMIAVEDHLAINMHIRMIKKLEINEVTTLTFIKTFWEQVCLYL